MNYVGAYRSVVSAPQGLFPTITVLCGSTRFGDAFREANLRETLAGKIVLTIGADTHSDDELWSDPVERELIKCRLDELHLRKIDLSDEVLVISVDGYLGESTRREIAYAIAQGKPVRWLEESARENWGSLNGEGSGRARGRGGGLSGFEDIKVLAPGQAPDEDACPLRLEGGFPQVTVAIFPWTGPGPVIGLDLAGLTGHYEHADPAQLDALGAWLGRHVAAALRRHARPVPSPLEEAP